MADSLVQQIKSTYSDEHKSDLLKKLEITLFNSNGEPIESIFAQSSTFEQILSLHSDLSPITRVWLSNTLIELVRKDFQCMEICLNFKI